MMMFILQQYLIMQEIMLRYQVILIQITLNRRCHLNYRTCTFMIYLKNIIQRVLLVLHFSNMKINLWIVYFYKLLLMPHLINITLLTSNPVSHSQAKKFIPKEQLFLLKRQEKVRCLLELLEKPMLSTILMQKHLILKRTGMVAASYSAASNLQITQMEDLAHNLLFSLDV